MHDNGIKGPWDRNKKVIFPLNHGKHQVISRTHRSRTCTWLGNYSFVQFIMQIRRSSHARKKLTASGDALAQWIWLYILYIFNIHSLLKSELKRILLTYLFARYGIVNWLFKQTAVSDKVLYAIFCLNSESVNIYCLTIFLLKRVLLMSYSMLKTMGLYLKNKINFGISS